MRRLGSRSPVKLNPRNFLCPRASYGALRLVHLEPGAVRDEAGNAAHHSLSRSFAVTLAASAQHPNPLRGETSNANCRRCCVAATSTSDYITANRDWTL